MYISYITIDTTLNIVEEKSWDTNTGENYNLIIDDQKKFGYIPGYSSGIIFIDLQSVK